MSHGLLIAALGFVIFVGAGAYLSTQVNCGLGAPAEDTTTNDSQMRSDDQSFFTHMVCTARKAQHNR